MNRPTKFALVVALLGAGAVAVAAGPAQASPSYESTSAMSQVVAAQDSTDLPEGGPDTEPRGVVGVAKALAAGFKAANAPRAAGNVMRLASVLGFAADAPEQSPEVEAAYFDR